MLKIKDNIDLTELEKFGFENKNDYVKICVCGGRVLVLKKNRKLFMEEFGDDTCYDTLYDLIKADMVEKVGAEL